MLHSYFRFLLVPLVACIGLLVGCDIPPRPPLDPSDLVVDSKDAVETKQSNGEPLEKPLSEFAGPWETWDAYFVDGRQVGYSHVVAEPVSDMPDSDIRYELENQIFLSQGHARSVQRLKQSSIETNLGRLRSFDATMQVGPAKTEYHGSVADGQLEIEIVRGSTQSVRQIFWEPSFRGLVAIEQSLRDRPMTEKGETRVLKILLPGNYQLATARMVCQGKAAVPVLDGSIVELIEIDSQVQVDEKQFSFSTIWTNPEGGIVRTFSPGLRLVAHRTDRENAIGRFDQSLHTTVVQVEGSMERPEDAKRVAYKVVVPKREDGSPSFQFPAYPEQYVRQNDDGDYDVLVSRRSEQVGRGFGGGTLVPKDADRRVSFLIDHKSSEVRKFSDAVLGKIERNDRDVAVELARGLQSLITLRIETQGFRQASKIAQSGRGDSTDHAILLAAMLRTRGIASQVAFGLRYVTSGDSQALVYHAWTIAYVDDQWIHLDATTGGMAAADRLMLSSSNLSQGSEYDALIPFLTGAAATQARIVAAQY